MSRKLTTKQLKAVHMLAMGDKSTNIAKELKLRPETLSRWKRSTEFNMAIDQVTEELRDRVRYRFLQLVEASIGAIQGQLGSRFCDPRHIMAAISVLKMLGMERVVLPTTAITHQTVPVEGETIAD